jgi:GNAT superfamily N-acetyltransferase
VDTVVIANDNTTTIGYTTIAAGAGELAFILVNPAFQRTGYGSILFNAAQKAFRYSLKPVEPIYPLGRKLFSSISLSA